MRRKSFAAMALGHAELLSFVPRPKNERHVRSGSICVVLAMSTLRPLSPDSGRKADIPVRLGPPHQLRNRQSEPSFTLVLVESGSIPKAIEFVLNPPADVPPA
jgi:hypothetical protein